MSPHPSDALPRSDGGDAAMAPARVPARPGTGRALARHTQRLRRVSAVVGWLRAAWIAPLWLLVRRYHVLVWEAESGTLPAFEPGEDWRRQAIGGPDLDRLVAANPHWDFETLERRLREDRTGVAWFRDGRLVHVRWSATGRAYLSYLELDFEVPGGDAISIDAFTPAGESQRGHYQAGLSWLLRDTRGRGGRRCVFFVAWWNRPIARLLSRLGARPAGSIDLWRLGPRRAWSLRGALERCGPRSVRLIA